MSPGMSAFAAAVIEVPDLSRLSALSHLELQEALGRAGEARKRVDVVIAALTLLTEAGNLPPEKVAHRARQLRDELDTAGIAAREADLRERRFLRLTRQADGMTKLFGLLDPESAALISDAFDCVTAPRRG